MSKSLYKQPKDMMIDNIIAALPSGSGFDCNWEHIKTQRPNKDNISFEVFETYYHNMNDGGYYDGYTNASDGRLRGNEIDPHQRQEPEDGDHSDDGIDCKRRRA